MKSVVFFVAAMAAADAVCCGPPLGGHITCDDGTETWTCCGVRKCNIFCCNCDGGCRKSHNQRECKLACDSHESVCESGCILGGQFDPFTGMCISKCMSEQSQCHKNCEQKFPSQSAVKMNESYGSLERYGYLPSLARFQTLDTNSDEKIDFDEFEKFMAFFISNTKGESPSHQIFHSFFGTVDNNGDGHISLEEFDKDTAEKMSAKAVPSKKTKVEL